MFPIRPSQRWPSPREPQDSAKGEFARSILYMAVFYGLPIRGDAAMLARWSIEDPPSAEKRVRNNAIDSLQHTRNPFIDYPELARLVELD